MTHMCIYIRRFVSSTACTIYVRSLPAPGLRVVVRSAHAWGDCPRQLQPWRVAAFGSAENDLTWDCVIRKGVNMGSPEADKLMKQADKHCNPSFFSMRIKGDWEQATPLYERAAKLYKVSSAFWWVDYCKLSPCSTRHA